MLLVGGRKIRIAVAVVVLLAAGWLLAPRVFSDLRSNGVVNAPIVTVRTPIDGLVIDDPPDVGARVSAKQVLFEVRDGMSPQPLLSQLDTELESVQSRVMALQEKLEAVTALRTRLEKQVSQFMSESEARLNYQFLEAQAREKSWAAVKAEREASYQRIRDLERAGYATKARLESAASLLEQARQQMARAQADKARLAQEMKSVAQGTYVGGRDDVPYSQQRLDEIIVGEANLRVELAEAKARAAATQRRLKEEVERAERRIASAIASPLDGIVWSRHANLNAVVEKGSPVLKVLDCRRLVIEVAISEGKADQVRSGDEVGVRLQGAQRFFPGVVQDVRGPRAVRSITDMVSDPPVPRRNEVVVTVGIQPEHLQQRGTNFCSVGRRAEVSFARPGGKFVRSLVTTVSEVKTQ